MEPAEDSRGAGVDQVAEVGHAEAMVADLKIARTCIYISIFL